MRLHFDLPCPCCKRKFKEQASRIRPGNRKTCPHCGTDIVYQGDDVSGLQRSVDDLEQTFKNFNRRLGGR